MNRVTRPRARPVTRGSLTREAHASEHIPYRALVEESVVCTRAGDYVQTLQLSGVPFECAQVDTLNGYHERLNVLLRNLASPHVSLWTHLIRRRVDWPGESACSDGFAAALQAAYRARWTASVGGHVPAAFENALYVSVVYRPLPQPMSAWAWRAARRQETADLSAQVDALQACRKIRQELSAAWEPYSPQWLTGVNGSTGMSSPIEFLSLLINGTPERRDAPRAPLNEVLATARLSFGAELVEYRSATSRRFGAMLGIKEYPAETRVGLLNALLSVPFECVLTQSFAFLSKATAQGLLQRQSHRLTNAGDFALSQAQALKEALDAVTSNAFVFGDHHLSLQVLSESVTPAHEGGELAGLQRAQARLQADLATARSVLADAGVTTAREDLGLEGAFWAQLPGQFALRARKAPITSRNLAALAPGHGYPAGAARGHWGEAVATFVTSARSAFRFHLHVQDIGHTFICGPTGAGKTAFVAFLIAQLTRMQVTQFILDKDQGLALLVRALGGAYLPLKVGQPTGLNPLTLPATAENVDFLKAWLACLVAHGGRPLSVGEEVDLEQALRATLEWPAGERRLSRVLEFLDASVGDGVHARLSAWCDSTHGEWAWVFDQAVEGSAEAPADTLVPRLTTHAVIGVDVTEFLAQPRIREPVTAYLFHLVRQLLDGRRLVCWIDEFWRVLSDASFQRFATDGPKTWRKLNAVMALATQSPSDVLASPLSRTIVEQTATQVFFPNAQAQWSDYGEGFGLNAREFALIRDELLPGSRRFLVRQGGTGVVCELNLNGMTDLLSVLSGRAADVALGERVRAEYGEDPKDWLAPFWAARARRDGADERALEKGLPTGEGT